MRLADEWIDYVDDLERINKKAADRITEYIEKHGIQDKEDRDRLIEVANAIIIHYSESAGTRACKMYEKIAENQGAKVAAAEIAELPKYGEVAKAINGAVKQSPKGKVLPQVIQRFTKQAGTDTMLKNAARDGARFAWVPGGNDTCEYCLMLAGTGWHKAGKKTLQGRYAGHIHANCKCTYAVDFDGTLEIDGYDPDEYDQMVRDCFGEDYGAEALLNSTWNKKRGKADYSNLNEFRDYLNRRRDAEKFLKTFSPIIESNAVAVARKEAATWIKQLSSSAKELIQKYAYNPNDNTPKLYERINTFIRNGYRGEKDYSEQVEIISHALKQSQLQNDYICYRGSEFNPFDGMKIGESRTAEQFLSTSVIRSRAFEGKYQFVIYAEKGVNAAYIEELSNKFGHQREMLFDKDVEYELLFRQGDIIHLRAKK